LNPGPRIRQLRLDAGLTQRQLADSTGIDMSNLSRIETGATEATVPTLSRIAEALDVSLPALFAAGGSN